MKKKAKAVPPAVSEYMAAMARKSHKALKGTSTAHERASKAAKARWAKRRTEKDRKNESETGANPK